MIPIHHPQIGHKAELLKWTPPASGGGAGGGKGKSNKKKKGKGGGAGGGGKWPKGCARYCYQPGMDKPPPEEGEDEYYEDDEGPDDLEITTREGDVIIFLPGRYAFEVSKRGGGG